MSGEQAGVHHSRKRKGSLNKRILRNTTLNILVLVFVSCVIMAFSMQSLANNILLDSLQPMARQSAKTVEANIHMLADRMMNVADDFKADIGAGSSLSDGESVWKERQEILTETAETYELYTIALYDLEGRLIQGIDGAPKTIEQGLFALMKETDNLTIDSSTIFQDKLGITMGIPIKGEEGTILYLACVYKYDTLNDVISSINLGKNGMAYMVNPEGVVTGHPDKSLVLGGSTLEQLNGGHKEALGRVTTGETGAVEFPVDGDEMLVAFSPIRGTQWSLVIQNPKSDYNHLINAAMLAAALSTLAVLVVSILLILRLSQSISRPVKSVTDRMIALSDGDLHTEVSLVSSGDELEVMTRTLDDTVESVNRYISDIQQVLTQVAGGNLRMEPQVEYKGDFILIRESLHTILNSMNETIKGLRAAAARVANMSDELNTQSGCLHQASLEQRQYTQELVCEVGHVREQLSNVTESTSQTRSKTEEITRCIQEANNRMAALAGAMDDISANTQEITNIAKAIEDIAFQTNILAINASIEAARAGEAGKGFSVVANEVKELASKSAEAAQSATDMVGNTRTIIQNGVKLTTDMAGSFRDISRVSEQISTISDQLVTAVQGQERALTVIEQRIDTFSAITDQNLQSASETKQSSGLLATEADTLRAHVKRFVLKEEKGR